VAYRRLSRGKFEGERSWLREAVEERNAMKRKAMKTRSVEMLSGYVQSSVIPRENIYIHCVIYHCERKLTKKRRKFSIASAQRSRKTASINGESSMAKAKA
jgi:hypothetical protein